MKLSSSIIILATTTSTTAVRPTSLRRTLVQTPESKVKQHNRPSAAAVEFAMEFLKVNPDDISAADMESARRKLKHHGWHHGDYIDYDHIKELLCYSLAHWDTYVPNCPQTAQPTLRPSLSPTLAPSFSPTGKSGKSGTVPPVSGKSGKSGSTSTLKGTKKSSKAAKTTSPTVEGSASTAAPTSLDQILSIPGATYFNGFERAIFPNEPEWSTVGDGLWGLDTERTNTGLYSIKSPDLSNEDLTPQSSNVTFTTNPDSPPGTLYFSILAGVEMPFDDLVYFLDGELLGYYFSMTDFESGTIDVPGGQHDVTFVYNYNPLALGGLPPTIPERIGATFIDDVFFLPEGITLSPTVTPVDSPTDMPTDSPTGKSGKSGTVPGKSGKSGTVLGKSGKSGSTSTGSPTADLLLPGKSGKSGSPMEKTTSKAAKTMSPTFGGTTTVSTNRTMSPSTVVVLETLEPSVSAKAGKATSFPTGGSTPTV